jgi:flavin-dependent dehydrogenase
LTLARRGIDVLVLEASSRPAWRIGETLPPLATPLLAELGLLDAFVADGHLRSYANLSAWGGVELASTDFIFDRHGNGWQLDRERFDARLTDVARHAGARLWFGTSLLDGPRHVDRDWELRVAAETAEHTIRTRWVVDATGRRCRLSGQLGARVTVIDSLVCVYAVARPSPMGFLRDVDTRTLVEAMPEGWWYTALMPGRRRTVAWLSDADILRQHPWRNGSWLRSFVETTRHVREVLDRHTYVFAETSRCVAARSTRLEPFRGPGWLAVGDAAMSFDPLSSQGVFNALYTGREAGQAIAEHFAGDPTRLDRYPANLAKIWNAYLQNRRQSYRNEVRWSQDPFWRRRHSSADEHVFSHPPT